MLITNIINMSRKLKLGELKLIKQESLKTIDLAIKSIGEESLDLEGLRKEVERRLQEGWQKISDEVAA